MDENDAFRAEGTRLVEDETETAGGD